MTEAMTPRRPVLHPLRAAAVIVGAVVLTFVLVVGGESALAAFGALASGQGNVVYGGASSTSLTTSAVCPLNGDVCSSTLTARVGTRIPFNMTLSNLYASQATAPSSGSTCVIVVRTSAAGTGSYVSTPLSCTIGAGATTCANTASTVQVAAGDSVQVEFVKNGTCSGYVNWGIAGTYSQ